MWQESIMILKQFFEMIFTESFLITLDARLETI